MDQLERTASPAETRTSQEASEDTRLDWGKLLLPESLRGVRSLLPSLYRLASFAVLLSLGAAGWCASTQKRASASTVDVLMFSDVHFDPFHDPAKIGALRRAPIKEWPAILDKPDSATQLTTFTDLQRACGIRGADSTWGLVQASLREAAQQQHTPLFITVSGDLLAHGFDCRFRRLDPSATPGEVSAFAEKTVAFLAQQLRAAFPKSPIYLALGNNDSGCDDYRDVPNSRFLKSVGASFAADLTDPANRASLTASFPHLGDYSVALPSPVRDTRLIVLQDIFESTHYLDCDGRPDSAPAAKQIIWLRKQLTEARTAGQQVWMMAHIPPGVDVYGTYHRYLFAPGQACSVKQPQMFLSNEALGDTIAEFSDIIRLAIFAHTHMDEIKLIQGANGAVPVKLVPSISPINGNEPAFVVAQVASDTATLKDYEVYSASSAEGTGWGREYRYSTVYGLPDFSAASVKQLTSQLIDDKSGEAGTSRTYERYFLTGGGTFAALGLQRLWPEYSCSLRERDPAAFHSCMCPANPKPGTAP